MNQNLDYTLLKRCARIYTGTRRILESSLLIGVSRSIGDQEGIRIGIAERRMGLGELTNNNSRYAKGLAEIIHIQEKKQLGRYKNA
jgi:hypothetical protein